MPIRFVCPLCWSVRDNVDDTLEGKTIKCNDCHAMAVAKHTPAPNLPSEFEAQAVASAWIDALSPPAPIMPPARSSALTPASPPTDDRSPSIVLSTGDIRQRYEIVDLVFAHGSSAQGTLKDVSAGQAFQAMVQWLGQAARQIGANAVIHVHVDFRPSGDAFEVYAYGTAVRLVDLESTA